MARALQDKSEIEYLSGRPYPKVSPKRIHAMVQGAATLVLRRCATGLGAVGPEWRFHLAKDTSLVPDLAFVSYERLRTLSDQEAEEPPFAPDIAIEVRSPSHRSALAREKIALYLAHGSRLVLDIDPTERALHAHNKTGARTYRNGEAFLDATFPWLRFEVSELFADIDIPR